MLAVSEGVLTVATGAEASAGGVTTISAGGAAVAGGVTTISAGGAAVAAGVTTVSAGVVTVAVGAAAAAAQCSEIMFSSVTAKLLSAAAELAPLALCPMRVTSWPRCFLKSILLVVILKVCPVPSSTTV